MKVVADNTELSPVRRNRTRKTRCALRLNSVCLASLVSGLFFSTAICGAETNNLGFTCILAVATPSQIFQWRPFLAPFHSVLLHFPIGFVAMAFILEVYSLFHPSAELRKITRLVMALSLASAAVVAALGLMRASSSDYDPHTLSLHRAFGLAVPACIVLALSVQRLAVRAESRRLLFGYRGLLAAALGVLVIAGHQGGNLTHGSKYLVENAPGFFRTLLEDNSTTETKIENGNLAGESLFGAKVRPLLETRCIPCHGAAKHKGSYRLDLPETALKGGDSGRTAITPGNPFESNLVRLILLPRDNDDVMPPEGKDALTSDEIMILIRWIQAGASFGEINATTAVNTVEHGDK